MSINVLLVDDHRIMREGLVALLEKSDDIKVIAEANDGREAVTKGIGPEIDVVVMDLSLPEMSGIEATKKILSNAPGKKILALSMLEERSCVMESLKAGAKGYLVKNCAGRELIQAIRSLASGESYLCSKVTNFVLEDYPQPERSPQPAADDKPLLTQRELEVLRLLADGCSTKDTAFQLKVSVKTVEVHRSRIMGKLELHSIAELTKYAIREGLTSLE